MGWDVTTCLVEYFVSLVINEMRAVQKSSCYYKEALRTVKKCHDYLLCSQKHFALLVIASATYPGTFKS